MTPTQTAEQEGAAMIQTCTARVAKAYTWNWRREPVLDEACGHPVMEWEGELVHVEQGWVEYLEPSKHLPRRKKVWRAITLSHQPEVGEGVEA